MVEGITPIQVSGLAGTTPREMDGGARFVVDAGTTPPSVPLSGAAAIGMESMLLLQAVDDVAERDRGARRRGAAMIAALTDLQKALIAEGDPALALRSLSELAAEAPEAADPRLAAVLRAVVLRARVEVARRERPRA